MDIYLLSKFRLKYYNKSVENTIPIRGEKMKKIPVLLLLMLASPVFALTPDFEKAGDGYFAKRNSITDTAAAMATADSAIDAFLGAYEMKGTDDILYKYVKAVDFKYHVLKSGTEEERKNAFKNTLAMIDAYCASNTNCAQSIKINYSYMAMWGRYGDLLDVMAAAGEGIAGKIKDYGERIYNADKAFKDYAASFALGRLHYKAPNIIFILTWPDKNKSKEYLEEFVKNNPGSITGKVYLADTLWELGRQDEAKKLFNEAMQMKPRKEEFFEDMWGREKCAARMKELGL
jgi:tetratricopeptide (TPR) repeat protein